MGKDTNNIRYLPVDPEKASAPSSSLLDGIRSAEVVPFKLSRRESARSRFVRSCARKCHHVGVEAWSIDEAWPAKDLGEFLTREIGSIHGMGVCIAVEAHSQEKIAKLASARTFEVFADTGSDSFHIFGDPWVEPPFKGHGLHEALVALRAALCVALGAAAERIVCAPGAFAKKAEGVGFVQVRLSQDNLLRYPTVLQRLALHSRVQEQNLETGLYRISDEALSRYISAANQMADDGFLHNVKTSKKIVLVGDRKIKIGPNLKKIIRLNHNIITRTA